MSFPKNLRRYHMDVFFPENTDEMKSEFFSQLEDDISLTSHALQEISSDRRGKITNPTKRDLMDQRAELIEFYEVLDEDNKPTGKMQKALIRVSHLDPKDQYDFTFIVAREGVVVTAWANDKSDRHRLTVSKYDYFDPNNDRKKLKRRKKPKFVVGKRKGNNEKQ